MWSDSYVSTVWSLSEPKYLMEEDVWCTHKCSLGNDKPDEEKDLKSLIKTFHHILFNKLTILIIINL